MGSLKIVNEEMRSVVVSLLSSDIETMKDLLSHCHSKPIVVAQWSGERRGLVTNGVLNSYQLAQAMYDALRNSKLYPQLNVEAMWVLHNNFFPHILRTPYDHYDFVVWNWYDSPGDNPYFDVEDEEFMLAAGISEKDICLTNYGIQHMEKEVVDLLKDGASPFFLVEAPWSSEMYVDKNGVLRHTYFDVAPLIEVTKMHSTDYWNDFINDSFEHDISSLPIDTLEMVMEGIFNVAACERILYLIDKYISEEARANGNKLMLDYLGKIYPIL